MPPRRRLPSAPTLLAPLFVAMVTVSPAWAQTPDAASLAKIVSDQAETIRRLEARLSALEARAPAAAAVAAPAAQPSAGPAIARLDPPKPAPQTKVDWSGGGAPEFSSPDGTMAFRVRGSMALDASTTSGSAFSARNITGTESRALRLGVDGNVSNNIAYTLEADFADGAVSLKSSYITWVSEAFGHNVELSFGGRINDRSIEGSSASETLTFLERNGVAGLGPQRGYFGIGLSGKVFGDGWHLGLQVTGDDVANTGDARDALTVSGRAHWNPIDTAAATVHLGAWGYHETLPATPVNLTRNSFVGSHFNDQTLVTSGVIPLADGSDAFGLEAGLIRGRVWGFIEAGERVVSSLSVADATLAAQSMSGGWFLTGEKLGYSKIGATIRRPRILQAVSKGGPGAWEVAGRFDHIDYTDAPLGGLSDIATLALNWYPEPSTRLMIDWAHWTIENHTGAYAGRDSGDTLSTRVQLAF